MAGVIHFEINADNPERIIEFYTKVFGWRIEKWKGPMEYWIIYPDSEEGDGIGGGIAKSISGEGIINTIGVDSVDEYVKRINKSGGSLVRPKMAIPGVGWLAYFKDIEGNVFGIMENDPKAK